MPVMYNYNPALQNYTMPEVYNYTRPVLYNYALPKESSYTRQACTV